MYNTSNPAELYPNTTWELLPNNKFLKTGSTPLQQGGNNSIKLTKTNLPAEKLQIDSFQLGRGTQEITGQATNSFYYNTPTFSGAFSYTRKASEWTGMDANRCGYGPLNFTASKSWTGMSTSAAPYTTNMGSGTPITINPEHITIRAWKRLS